MEATNKIRIVKKGFSQYIYGLDGFDGCECREDGEGIYRVYDENDDTYLVNTRTLKVRKIQQGKKLVGFSSSDIDYEAISGIENNYNAYSLSVEYTPVLPWDDCKDGILALSWMLYPDGEYFADEDGFGMEDNDEVKVYCVMDDNLKVILPFAPQEDIRKLLSDLRKKKREGQPLVPATKNSKTVYEKAYASLAFLGYFPKKIEGNNNALWFDHEDVRMILCYETDDPEYLVIGVRSVLTDKLCDAETMLKIANKSNAENSYVKAMVINDTEMGLFYERELMGDEDLDIILPKMVSRLAEDVKSIIKMVS